MPQTAAARNLLSNSLNKNMPNSIAIYMQKRNVKDFKPKTINVPNAARPTRKTVHAGKRCLIFSRSISMHPIDIRTIIMQIINRGVATLPAFSTVLYEIA